MATDRTVSASGTPHGLRRDLGLALLLAFALTVAWTLNDWERLRHLVLPDNDDMMRLAQVRDWIAGQRFNDWTQYRLAPPLGGPMHWSRINDVGPAAIILALRPLVGAGVAELVAVILYPALLFTAYLVLSARIAGRLGGAAAGPVAAVLAALAYPANALFLPGRIDHHALQIVLILGAVLAAMAAPLRRSGALIGCALALSLVIGLETAPHSLALMAVLFFRWVAVGEAERGRAGGLGLALGAVTLLFLLLARPLQWSETWCDAFTPASSTAMLAVAGWWLALAGVTPRLRSPRARFATGTALAVAAGAVLVWRYPGCLGGPYGPMDPFVRRAFMDHVGEAQPLFSNLAFTAIPAGGLLLTGAVVTLWLFVRRPAFRASAAPLAAVLAVSVAIALFQLRGAYLGAALVAPFLAQIVLGARQRRGPLRIIVLLGAWVISAGIVHLSLGQWLQQWLAPAASATSAANRSCKTGAGFAGLRAYPAGVVMAPIDWGAYLIGGTSHSAVSAGYHRNNRGNRAGYAFFLARPEQALGIARRWNARYVLLCPNDFRELAVRRDYPYSMAALLLDGRAPAWLEALPLAGTGLRFYRIAPGSDLRPGGLRP